MPGTVRPSVDFAALVAAPPPERLALVESLCESLRADLNALPISVAERALVAECRAELWEEQEAAGRAARADLGAISRIHL